MSIIYDMPDADRFWSRVSKTETCWIWTGSHTSAGYGNLRLPSGKNDYAHRVAYRFEKGATLAGMHLDHLCRNRECVNPDHLEQVTPRENIRRGAAGYSGVRTECRHGHDITDVKNVYTRPDGSRICRACASAQEDKRRMARRQRGDRRKILKTHCIRGHEYDDRNTYVDPSGHRHCRKCGYIRLKGYREARRAD